MPQLLVRIVITLLAASSLSVIAPPVNLHWLHWVALAPMMWVMRPDMPRSNRWLAFTYGTVSTLIIFRWLATTIMTFSNLNPALAWIATGLFAMVFGLPWLILWTSIHPLRRRLGAGWVLAIPALQVVLEYSQMLMFLFPYNLGVSQYRTEWVWQLGSVTGIAGITFLLFFVNATLAETAFRRAEDKPPPYPWLGAAAAAVVLTLGFGAWRHASISAHLETADIVRVGMVQTDKTMLHRFSESRAQMIRDWVDATQRLTEAHPDGIDLVVWSEGSSPRNVHEGRTHTMLQQLVQQGGFELLLGGGTTIRRDYPVTDEEWAAHRERDPNEYDLIGHEPGDYWGENYNSVYLFGRDGEIRGRYDKVVPLPFGEYLPLANIFPILRTWIQGPGDFRAGSEVNTISSEFATLGTPICYEAILPYLGRQYTDVDLILNPTNDAWFSEPGPQLHAMLATGRAMELGVPLVRTAFTGVSMVVLPNGDIIHEVAPFIADESVVNVPVMAFDTPYKRFGDWFTWLCLVGLIVSLAASPWFNGQKRPVASAPDPAAQ
ncbi:MAG: apolipoprotein N-acyltransferase [Myxococcota bacterium]|jgi:apolipoprotein N-acyltransferase